MRSIRLLSSSAVAAVLLSAVPAQSATLLFELTATPLFGGGTQTAIFQLDSMPTPDRINDQSIFGIEQIFFNNVSGIFNGINTTANIGFGRGNVANIQVLGQQGAANRINASTTGPSLFTGSLSAPTFATGTFTAARSSLVISEVAAAVPEPSTWAMLVLGFGFIGASMRMKRRKQNVSVSYG